MKCPNCNFENDSVSNFCINCGTKLKVNDFGVESYSNDLNYSPITSSENKIIFLCNFLYFTKINYCF